MDLITAKEARQLYEIGATWRENHLVGIMKSAMQDIHDAALAGKTAITLESVPNEVIFAALESELARLGFEVRALRSPWPPRSLEISW
ncbi:MAG: hypothetical protein HKL98_07315 [Burkholderiales bacterium]|nr:hypothetical protein [Burkholderiales bacterium]